MDVAKVVSALVKYGVRPSHPRLCIYDFLWENRIHPTVDEVFSRLHPVHPTLSRTTVYNTLKLFVRKEVIRPVIIEDHEMRYDIGRHCHGHFKCLQCGKIYDVPLAEKDASQLIQSDSVVLDGFIITHKHLNYHGTCRECIDQQNTIKNKKNIKIKRRVQ